MEDIKARPDVKARILAQLRDQGAMDVNSKSYFKLDTALKTTPHLAQFALCAKPPA